MSSGHDSERIKIKVDDIALGMIPTPPVIKENRKHPRKFEEPVNHQIKKDRPRKVLKSKLNQNGEETVGTYGTRESIPTGDNLTEKELGNYSVIKKIGEGSLSKIYKCKHKQTGEIWAIKCIEYGGFNDVEKENVLNEIRVLASIDHPNIIGYKESFIIKAKESQSGKDILK